MLSSLHIRNYALIDELDVSFNSGFSIITGETGAGKSILLGGLALVLGKRADLSQVKYKDKKCVIEAVFDIANYNLKPLFNDLDLDFEVQTIVRREILPSGKSRAFINDTPVNLESLSRLSDELIDVHSQHQTHQLTQDYYQFQVIDALADNSTLLNTYDLELQRFKSLQTSLQDLKQMKADLLKEHDYNLFLLNELTEMNLESFQLQDLETKYEELNNVEEIGQSLGQTKALLSSEGHGVQDQVFHIKQELNKIAGFGPSYQNLKDRFESVSIELDDLYSELEQLQDGLQADPQELERIDAQLRWLNNLLSKHAVSTIEELVLIRTQLQTKVSDTDDLDLKIVAASEELEVTELKLKDLGSQLSSKRKETIPILISRLEAILSDLGMPNARFKIELSLGDRFKSNGMDDLSFLFMANKGSTFNELKKAASGGELSRIMLAIKAILGDYIQLPTLMFDEIDTGVSGEISHKMGAIMRQMSKRMQVFSITHLPQIAAKGDTHYKVYKTEKNNKTQTQLKQLSEEDRIVEIAQMLGGLDITESALAHARQLLN